MTDYEALSEHNMTICIYKEIRESISKQKFEKLMSFILFDHLLLLCSPHKNSFD